MSTGSSIGTLSLRRARPCDPDVVEPVGLDQAVPDRSPVGRDQRERHGAADQQRVDAVEQRADRGELVGDLRAAEDRDVRTGGLVEQGRQDLDLALEQPAGHRGTSAGDHQLRERGDARVRAVRGAERIVDVRVGELGQPTGERRIVRLLSGLEAEVLQKDDLVGWQLVRGGGVERRDGAIEELRQPDADGPETQVVARLPLRPAEVRGEHERRSAVQQLVKGRERGADAQVVGDRTVVQRDVEVHADEDTPVGDVAEIVERSKRHSDDATSSTRSRRRFE